MTCRFTCLLLPVLALAGTVSRAAEPAEAPLTLEQAVQRALAKNYTIQVETLSRPIARAGLTEAYGKLDPSVQGSYKDTRDEQPDLANALGVRPLADITKETTASLALVGTLPWGMTYNVGANTENERYTSNGFADTYRTFAGVSLTQPLLRDAGFGATLVNVRLARTNLAMSEWDYRGAVTDIVTRVIYAYSDPHFAQAQLRSARRSRDLAAQLHKENTRRHEVQRMSEFDVLSASARVAAREDNVLQAEYRLVAATNALKQLISDERTPALLDQPLAIEPLNHVADAAPNPAADFANALAQRPDYQIARLNVRRGDINRRYALNQALPRVDATGSYGYNGIGTTWPDSRRDTRLRDYSAYGAGVTVSVPVTFSAERGRYRAAKLRHQQASLELQQLEQTIVVSLGNAAQQVESTRLRVAATREARARNESMLEAELKRLRAGTGSTFDVLYQQEQLSYAEINEAAAQSDHIKALAEYDRQLGRTLATHHIELRAD